MSADEIFVTEKVLNEFARRIDEEDKRQNARIDHLEKNLELVNNLYVSVERLASNMESMAKELSRQGDCLRDLEMKPAKKWDLIVSAIISGIVGVLIGLISSGVLK